MSYNEIASILGKLKGSEKRDAMWVVRRNLQEPWNGMVPYAKYTFKTDNVFSGD
ncbi:MAG: hypothetical protein GXO47_12005 [Chlorobi bacterium]|nr:hypothetical protein [Chlorobiota bacterium]